MITLKKVTETISICKELDMILVQRKICVLCVCVRGNIGEKRKHKIDRCEKLNTKKEGIYSQVE